ncbi:MAG TPA: hypothetical protein VK555_09280, partial [Terriglobales bacterium]|nr:hypothetical protein [Terriglobales bacterium]
MANTYCSGLLYLEIRFHRSKSSAMKGSTGIGFWDVSARAKGKRLGRPQTLVDTTRIIALRASGVSWREISKRLKVP